MAWSDDMLGLPQVAEQLRISQGNIKHDIRWVRLYFDTVKVKASAEDSTRSQHN